MKLTFVQKVLQRYFSKDIRILSSESDEPDVLLEEAINSIADEETVNPTMLQTKLKIGYARALRIFKDLENLKITPYIANQLRSVNKGKIKEYFDNKNK